jgi:hypothetical protein
MYGAMFHAVAKPGRKQDLLNFLQWDADVARESEPGTIAFDVYQDPLNRKACTSTSAIETSRPSTSTGRMSRFSSGGTGSERSCLLTFNCS